MQKIPYPPSPTDVPEGFTDYADSFTRNQSRLLAGLFAFLIFYIAMIIFFAMVGTWCALTLAKWPIAKAFGLVVCSTFFLYLIKGFFKRHPMNKDMHIEITDKDHPLLFGFIEQLCEELDAPLPNKVFVSPDVNAACISRTSLMNIVVPPKRDLLIGLGLVNCMNLSEFKAVLAHEFGHFCHLGPTNSYAYVVKRIIFDLVDGEDWFDRIINWCTRQNNAIGLFGKTVHACLWVGRKILWWVLKVIALQDRALSREQEFHADKVAVSAAGSDASTHGLLRARFGMYCFIQAINDLVAPARDHKIYTTDLYLHQDRAAAILRRKKNEPELGLPPTLPTPTSGKSVKVFDAEQDELEDNDSTPPMWRTHPSDADREANAKEKFIPAKMDHRSPWILFSDAAELKERMTYKFYRREFKIPKDADLTEAQKVQQYIDNEYAETTYDPKYHGAYDDRPIEPGDLSELHTIARDSPWSVERMLKVYDKLYEGCREHAETRSDLYQELQSLRNNVVGKPSAKMKRMMEDVEKKIDTNWEWFKSFDRRVYLLHFQMAQEVDESLKEELIERYRFQLVVQRLYQEARKNYNDSDACLNRYFAASRGEIRVPADYGAQVIAVLRAAWKALKKILQDAREINLPAMKNFEEGERLADFILEGKMVPEPPLRELKGVWVQKLMNQLQGVKNRCFRLHFKSVGGVLATQEKIAAAWLAKQRPVEAAVVQAEEVVIAEVLPDEAIAAEVIEDGVPAQVLPRDDVVDSLPLCAIPPEVAHSDTMPPEPSDKAMAAFVASPPASTRTAEPKPQQTTPPVPTLEDESTMPEAVVSKDESTALPPIEKTPETATLPESVAAPIITLERSVTIPTESELVSREAATMSKPAPARQPKPVKPAQPAEEILALDEEAPIPVEEALPLDAEPLPLDAEPLPLDAEPLPLDAEPELLVAELLPLEDEPLPLDAPEPMPPQEVHPLDSVAPPTEEIFELGADAVLQPESDPAPIPAAAPTKPIPPRAAFGTPAQPASQTASPAATKPTSGTIAQPQAKAAASGTMPAPPIRPEPSPAIELPSSIEPANSTPPRPNSKRPPVKITFVKPGEKSPFAK